MAFFIFSTTAIAQETGQRDNRTMLAKVQSLDLESVREGVVVHYKPGYKERAEKLGPLLNDAIQFFKKELGITQQFHLALVDSLDWIQISSSPYGLPHVSGMNDEDPPVAVLPVSGEGTVYDFMVSLDNNFSKNLRQRIQNTGYSWEEISGTMVDLVSLHELGHVYKNAYGIGEPALWFNEFMANYFSYLYMFQQRPELAEIWDITGHAIQEGFEPQYHTLEDFEKRYVKVGVGNYAWYQSAFEMKANPLVEKYGLSFVKRMKEVFPNGVGKIASEKVLEELETNYPGFQEWAQVFKRQ
ncbi:hypothetical protein [Fodinibius sp. SL11]|uniref:hypothetical protein n=1 Tax=Fodinibius sp. SL11 TaxID=3425690 RepID=UPI003F88405B